MDVNSKRAALWSDAMKLASGIEHLEADNERLRAMLLWIGEYEPSWLDDAEKKFGPVQLQTDN